MGTSRSPSSPGRGVLRPETHRPPGSGSRLGPGLGVRPMGTRTIVGAAEVFEYDLQLDGPTKVRAGRSPRR